MENLSNYELDTSVRSEEGCVEDDSTKYKPATSELMFIHWGMIEEVRSLKIAKM